MACRAVIRVERNASGSALVTFEGNRYNVLPNCAVQMVRSGEHAAARERASLAAFTS